MPPEANQTVEMNQDDEIDAIDLFNEIADADDFPSGDSDDVDDSLGHVDEEQPEEDHQEQPDESPQASEDQTDADAPDAQEDAETDAQSETPNPDEDLWEGASEAQLTAFRELQHDSLKMANDVRANAGRVQGYAKKLNEVEAELEQLKAKQSTPSKDTSGDDISLDGKSLQEIEEDYPEVAQYVRHQVQQAAKQFDQKLDPVLNTTSKLQGSFEQMTANEQQAAVNRELDALKQSHPDYLSVRQSNDFNQWLGTRTHGVSPEYKHQLVNSMSAADNIDLLDMYKASRPAPPPSVKHQEADAARRDRLAEHAEIPRQGAAPPQGLPEDPIELFNLIADD